jgi:hypothetical protein
MLCIFLDVFVARQYPKTVKEAAHWRHPWFRFVRKAYPIVLDIFYCILDLFALFLQYSSYIMQSAVAKAIVIHYTVDNLVNKQPDLTASNNGYTTNRLSLMTIVDSYIIKWGSFSGWQLMWQMLPPSAIARCYIPIKDPM